MAKKVSRRAEEVLKAWLKDHDDPKTREEIKEIMNDPEALEHAFNSQLEFGTAGIRDKMGPGPGLMNNDTIAIATQGLADYLLTYYPKEQERGVVVCHDSRMHSREFAEVTASVLAGNGIKVYLVKDLRPTPFCSFCVRYYKALAGVNITASHNPKEYNGYKVYSEDGGQIVSPGDHDLIELIHKVKSIKNVKRAKLTSPLIHTIDRAAEEDYLRAIYSLSIQKEQNKMHGKELKIVYTPLHGAGGTMIPKALENAGFTNFHIVKEQFKPDGNFPTASYPNPEMDAALTLLWRDLIALKADIALASDPDSDRLSCSIIHDGKPLRFTGNEMGMIMLSYLIKMLKPEGKWATITTIVSTHMTKEMTERHGGTFFEVLTGFKYIGELIHKWERRPDGYQFLFGFEESLGFLHGTHARDKDATIASLLMAEIALDQKLKGKTLLDYLYAIYKEYGIYRSAQVTKKIEGGLSEQTKFMKNLREHLPSSIGNIKVTKVKDYLKPSNLPLADVLIFYLVDGSIVTIRPSGTEPKVKFYCEVMIKEFLEIEKGIQELDNRLEKLLKDIAQ